MKCRSVDDIIYFVISFFLLSFFSNSKLSAQAVDQKFNAGQTTDSIFLIIDSLQISGNKKTKDYIIEQEITFRLHDSIGTVALQEAVKRSEKNLLNTSLFLSAKILITETTAGHAYCIITVTERWYVFPRIYFSIADRNFNVWWVEHDHELSRVQYGAGIIWYNFTGNKDNLGIDFIAGYTQKIALSYNRPYLFKHAQIGGGFAIAFANNKQLAYSTIDDKHLFYKDSLKVTERFSTGIQINKRVNLYQLHLLKLKYHNSWITDTILKLNPEYFTDGNREQFFSLSYTYTINHVREKSYPLHGDYTEFQAVKIGFGPDDKINQVYLAAQYNKYFELRPHLFLQGQAAMQLLFSDDFPYSSLISLGYCENFVRGYEYYVIDGQQTYLIRTNLKWNFLNFQFKIPLIHWAAFDKIPVSGYLKLFSDAGYVTDHVFNSNNFLTNTPQYSLGAGIDIASYYDWVLRLETTVNALSEVGFYLHLGLDLNTHEDCNLW